MSDAQKIGNLYLYPPSEFRWRLWLLIERISKIFVVAQKGGMCRPSLRHPRGQWAHDHKDRDPFAGAVWNCDQVLKPQPRDQTSCSRKTSRANHGGTMWRAMSFLIVATGTRAVSEENSASHIHLRVP